MASNGVASMQVVKDAYQFDESIDDGAYPWCTASVATAPNTCGGHSK